MKIKLFPLIIGTFLLFGLTTFFCMLSQELPLGEERTILSLSGFFLGLGFFIMGINLSIPKKKHTHNTLRRKGNE